MSGKQPDYSPPSQALVAFTIGGAVVAVLVIVLVALGVPQALSGPDVEKVPVPQVDAADQPPVQQKPTIGELLDQQKTLEGAVGIASLTFKDSSGDGEASPGAALLASWMDLRTPSSTWSALAAIPDNRRVEIEKDVDPYRGRKLCLRGTIVEIRADRSMRPPVFWGAIATSSLDFVRFVAVGSTSGVVEDSPVHFCGIVIGIRSYPNRMGGVTNAIEEVGLFDLPENR